MTIISVDKAWSRSGANAVTTDGQTFNLTIEEGYQVVHSADATDVEIMRASGLPLITSKHPDCYAICKRIGPYNKIGPIFSMVGVGYEGQFGPGQLNDNPVNKRPEYTWSDTTSNEPMDEDWNGKPITTVNGEPIHGATMELADQTLTVTRNFALFSPWLTHQYRHSVNSDEFAGYAPGTARLVGFSAVKEYADTFEYWKTNARIQFRFPYRTTAAKAWYLRTKHEGYYRKVGTGGTAVIIRACDENGEPMTRPVLLDPQGYRISKEEVELGVAYWLEFKRYQSLPYSALGLL